ncbi:MAG: HrpA-like RNA helicase, partial [Candidatus Saccharimonadales bacterium]
LPEGSDGLYLTEASQANLEQRAGRVGRTAPGEYVLASPSDRSPLIPYDRRPEFATPAMQRSRLDGLLLQLSATGFSVEDLKFFHKPPEQALQAAKSRLKILGALDIQGTITKRGKQMDALPLDPELACMVVFALEKGYNENVVRNVVDIVSIMQTGGILKRSHKEQKWRSLLEKDTDGEVKEKDSDLFAQLEAYVELTGTDTNKWERYDVYEHSVGQVDENRESLLKRLRLDAIPVTRVGQEDRQAVRHCINAGQLNQIWQRRGKEWTLATDYSEHYSLAESSTVSRLGELVTGALFSLGVRGGKVYADVHNVSITTLEDLEVVAAHLWVEEELSDSRRFSEEKQEFVATIERKLGSLVIGSYERVVEVNHGTNEATLYSSIRNSHLFKTWMAENPAKRDLTKEELASMIGEPEQCEYGVDPITQEPLLAWRGANGWVASEEIARVSLLAGLKRLEKIPKSAERKTQKAVVKAIRSGLTPFKGDDPDVKDWINGKKDFKDLGEWIEEGEKLLKKCTD